MIFVVGHPSTTVPQGTFSRAKQVYDRAVQLERDGNYAAALSLLWEAAGLAPRDADIQNRLGEALERIGALDASVAAYRTALRETELSGVNNLIPALVKVGKGEEAVERARAVSDDRKDPDRYFTLGLAHRNRTSTRRWRAFVEHRTRPRPRPRYNLALALNRSDRASEAVDELKRALAIDPSLRFTTCWGSSTGIRATSSAP